MKRVFYLLILCMFIVGCSKNEKPDGVSEEMYSNAIRIIEITDDFLDGKIGADEAVELFNEIKIDTDILFDKERLGGAGRNEKEELIDRKSEYPKDMTITVDYFDINTAITAITFSDSTEELIESIKEDREELANIINYNK